MSSGKTSIAKSLQSAKELFAAGELIKAEDICQDILRVDPDNADACHLLGVITHRNGKTEQAVELFNKAISLVPVKATYYNNLGNACRDLDRHDDALAAYRNAVRLNPSFAEAHNNMGNMLKETGKILEAIGCFKKALQIRPDLAVVYLNLGKALQEIGIVGPAIGAFQKAVHLQPDYARAHLYLGQLLEEVGRPAEAETCLRKALDCRPDYIEACTSLAHVSRQLGKIDDALIFYRKALELKPDFYEAYRYITSLVSQKTITPYYSATHKDVVRVRQQLDSENLEADDAMNLHFALGDMYDNGDLFEEAFNHYQQANLIRRESIDYDIPRVAEYTEEIINTFNKEFYEIHKFRGSDSSIPVFIIGLPRSGKTLTEQLVATHNKVFAGGEITKLARVFLTDLPIQLKMQEEFPAFAGKIDNNNLMKVARDYEKDIMHLAGHSCQRITNTLSDNIFFLGMIALLLPKAKIIFCRRDALDNCLAIYFKCFGGGHKYAFDLKETGFYYRQYEKLMAHWRNVLPMAIHEVNYDKLIALPEDTAKDLIDFLELDCDAGCTEALRHRLSSEKHGGNGLSVQFMHDRFIGRAQKYKKFLAPLKESLKQFAE